MTSCSRASTTLEPSAPPLRRWGWLLAVLAFAALAEERTLELDDGAVIRYELLPLPSAGSAAETARRMLELLSQARIDQAAAMSNAPERRRQVLGDYRDTVGESEFKRVFAQYASPPNRLVAEVVIGERHLLVWDLVDAGHRLAGQYFVRAGDGFLLDDAPNAERSRLQRVLGAYRQGRITP
jgi:hypothetical protein